MTSTLIVKLSIAQLEDSLGALGNVRFEDDELAEIDRYATDSAHQHLGALVSGLEPSRTA